MLRTYIYARNLQLARFNTKFLNKNILQGNFKEIILL